MEFTDFPDDVTPMLESKVYFKMYPETDDPQMVTVSQPYLVVLHSGMTHGLPEAFPKGTVLDRLLWAGLGWRQ